MNARTYSSISRVDYWFLLFSVNAVSLSTLLILFLEQAERLTNYTFLFLLVFIFAAGMLSIVWQRLQWKVSLKRLYFTYAGAAFMSFAALGLLATLIGALALWLVLPFTALLVIGFILGSYGLSVS